MAPSLFFFLSLLGAEKKAAAPDGWIDRAIGKAFRTFDVDKDGSLSREELIRGLTTLGAAPEDVQKARPARVGAPAWLAAAKEPSRLTPYGGSE